MGNNIGGGRGGAKRRAKIMKIDGEISKLKLPATADDVLKDYPEGYVLLESGAVKRCGVRAPRLRPEEELKPKKVYFLVELPKFPEENLRRTRGVRPDVHVGSSAKDRLEMLMLRKRSSPDLGSGLVSGSGPVRVKVRLPRARIEKLMGESMDDGEVAEKILELCLQESAHELGPAHLMD